MDHFENFESANFNGIRGFGDEERFHHQEHHHARPVHHERPDKRNYKLVCDPALRHGPQKIYRFDGESATEKEIIPADPRSRFKRFWTRREPLYLPLPKFKYDENYVGKPLAKEVTFANLNDNINQAFLEDMCKSLGTIEEVKIYYHPRTKKHLGIGKVLFTSTKAARLCAEKYHDTSKMGNVMNVFVDVMGKERATLVENLSQETPNKFRPPSPDSLTKRRSGGENRDRRMAARRERDHRGGPHHHNDYHGAPTPGGSSDHSFNSGVTDMSYQDSGYIGSHHSDHGSFPNTPHTPGMHGGPFQDGFHGHHVPPHGHGGQFGHDNHGMSFGHDMGARGHGYDMGMNPDFQHPHHPDYDMHNEQYDQYGDMSHQHLQHHGNHGHFEEQSFHRKERDRDRNRDRDRDRHNRRDFRKDRRRDSGDFDRGDRDHRDRRSSRDGKDRDYRDHRDRDNRHKDRYKDKHREQPQQPKDKEPFQSPPQPIRIPHHREDSPVKEEEPRKLSLESRIASLLRTNSQESDSSGVPFGSPNSSQPPLPQETPPPLPEGEAPPLPEPPSDEPPPLPPDPECGEYQGSPVVQWVGGGSQPLPPGTVDVMLPDGSYLVHEGTPNSHCDMQGSHGTTPNMYVDEGSRASGTPAYENGSAHGTPQYQDMVTETKARKKTTRRKDSSDMELDDDKMSLSSNESGEGRSQVNEQKTGSQSHPAVNNKDAPYGTDTYYGGVSLDDMSLEQVMNELTLDTHREVEENTFVNVVEQVVKELKLIVSRDMDKRMVHTTGFKSFDVWWNTEETRHKSRQEAPSSIKGPMPGTSAPTSLSAMSQDTSSSLSALFAKKDAGDLSQQGSFGIGGLLGLRGGMSKLPSFRIQRKLRPPTPPGEEPEEEEEEEKRKGPQTPPDLSDEESESEVELDLKEAEKSTNQRKQRVRIYSSDESDESDSDKADSDDAKSSEEERDEQSSASSSSSEDESSEDESSFSSEEEDEDEEIDVGTERDEISDVEKDKKAKEIEIETKNKKEKNKKKSEEKGEKVEVIEKNKEKTEKELPPIKEEDETVKVKTELDESMEEGEVVDDKREESVRPENEIKKEPDDSEKKVQALTEKERGAFDVLMELKKSPIAPPPVPITNDVEKDAAMALLQMGETNQRDAEEVAREEKLQKERATIAFEHDYFARPGGHGGSTMHVETDETDSADEGDKDQIPTLPPSIAIDHNYCVTYFPGPDEMQPVPRGVISNIDDIIDGVVQEAKREDDLRKAQAKQKRKYVPKKKLKDVTNLQSNRELASLFTPAVPKPKPDFKVRSMHEEMKVKYDFLIRGIDEEDIGFLKRSYEELLKNDNPQTYWLNDTHWVDHSQTLIPDPQPSKKRRKYTQHDLPAPHKTGCARTEGYYKISHQAKSYLRAQRQVGDGRGDADGIEAAEKKKKMSRDARSETRRIQNVLSSMGEDVGDLLKFNQLQFRKKAMTFRRSSIHDWGLFAQEPIAAEEMVIEYVGAVLRHSVADLREKKYEASGIGSSYLFRIDHDNVIDATKCGNLARFINHCCNPNCYAKIITVDGHKKIVIYSKRDIDVNEEITYDYKFPIEDEKIPCLCGAPGCRGTLN